MYIQMLKKSSYRLQEPLLSTMSWIRRTAHIQRSTVLMMTFHIIPRLTRGFTKPRTFLHWNHPTVSCCPRHNAPKPGAITSHLETRFTSCTTNILSPWTLLLILSINRASTKNATAFPCPLKIWTQHRHHSRPYYYRCVLRRRSVSLLHSHNWN